MEYEFVCAGALGPLTVDELQVLTSQRCEARTTLVGTLRDSAELHGLLTRFESLGIELIGMRRLPDAWPESSRDGGSAT